MTIPVHPKEGTYGPPSFFECVNSELTAVVCPTRERAGSHSLMVSVLEPLSTVSRTSATVASSGHLRTRLVHVGVIELLGVEPDVDLSARLIWLSCLVVLFVVVV